MKSIVHSINPDIYLYSLYALGVVGLTTIPLVYIGRNTLGEAVIALLYLVPVSWSTARWGQAPGCCAVIASALAFDYFFIPPFHTFTVGSLEGWLVLIIFLLVAIIVVNRIQSGLTRAQASEREAIFLCELSTALAGMRTEEAVAHVLARHLQQLFQAALVEVFVQPENQKSPIVVAAPIHGKAEGKPDRLLPILAYPGLIGEIRIWKGYGSLPPEDSRLMSNFCAQASLALEHARFAEAEARAYSVG